MSRSKSNTRGTEGAILDRISELPDVVIQHIFSFLEPKTAAKTSVVSKWLFHAWSTRPVLDFESRFTQNLTDVVYNTLRNFHQKGIPIQKFRLHVQILYKNYICFSEVSDHRIDFYNWLRMIIQMVIQKDILELDLCVPTCSFVHINGDIKCGNLKILKLKQVGISECSFHYFISSCPLLEELHLKQCPKLTKIHAATIPRLRIFDLLRCENVKEINVNLPRLESFVCHGGNRDGVEVINFGECKSLKSLSLSYSSITVECLQSLLSKNPLIENLRLKGCSMLGKLVISSLRLKRLRIAHCWSLEFEIDAPNLHLLEYIIWMPRTKFPLLLRNPAGKGKSDIRDPASKGKSDILFRYEGEISADWLHSLRELLTMFRKSTITLETLAWLSNERLHVIPIPNEHEVELYLNLNDIHLPLLEILLSLCHPSSVECYYSNKMPDDNVGIRYLCQELRKENAVECCGSSQIKCWRHYVMGSKLFYIVNNERKPLDWISLIIPSNAPIELQQAYGGRIAFDLDWKPL